VRWTTGVTTGEIPQGMTRGERDVGAIGSMLLIFIVVLGLGLLVPAHLSVLLERASDIVGGHP